MAVAAGIGRVTRTGPRSRRCVDRSGRSWRQCERFRAVVEAKLELRWSPQQISGWLVAEFPDDPEMRVSHETIYLSLFVQAKGALRKELTRYLRTRARAAAGRSVTSVMNGQGQLTGSINISERPAEAEDRAVPGHWEGDLIFGKAHERGGDAGGAQDPVRDADRAARRPSRPSWWLTRLSARSASCPTS